MFALAFAIVLDSLKFVPFFFFYCFSNEIRVITDHCNLISLYFYSNLQSNNWKNHNRFDDADDNKKKNNKNDTQQPTTEIRTARSNEWQYVKRRTIKLLE